MTDRALGNEHLEALHEVLPTWVSKRQGIWLHCSPRLIDSAQPDQGWKIHISVTPSDSVKAIAIVAALCGRHGVPFKVLADVRLTAIAQSHIWPRSQSGKCFAIYPADNTLFLSLIGQLDDAFEGFPPGPHILTDHVFGDSGCVFYRYGAFRSMSRRRLDGSHEFLVTGADGHLVEDSRDPWPATPDWIEPIIPEATGEDPLGPIMLNGRYEVEEALKFTNLGGVYLARDRSRGAKVILKEGRPGVTNPAGTVSGMSLLRREHLVLTRLAHTGAAPTPVDIFEQDGHLFIVTDYLEHDYRLGAFTAGNNPLYTTSSGETADRYYAAYLDMLIQIATSLGVLHESGFVMGDMAFDNALVSGDDVTLIDFGAAFEVGVDHSPLITTPGMGRSYVTDTYNRDIRAFGYLIAGMYVIPAGLAELDPHAPLNAARYVAHELGRDSYPVDLAAECLNWPVECTSDDIGAIRTRLVEYAATNRHVRGTGLASGFVEPTPPDWHDVMSGILEQGAVDRATLYELDPLAYEHDPLAFSWGVSGVFHVAHACGLEIPADHLAWWEAKASSTVLAPGLYTGAAGVALVALELGKSDLAKRLLAKAISTAAAIDDCSLFQGLAGLGLACVSVYERTGESSWLTEAEKLAGRILDIDRLSQSPRRLGLGYGTSGESLLFLRLFVVTGAPTWRSEGLKLLRGDISEIRTTSWGFDSCVRSTAPEDAATVKQYLYEGSSGLAAAVSQWAAVLKVPDIDGSLSRLESDCTRVLTSTGGLLTGLAGLGMSLLDLYSVTKRDAHLAAAQRIGRSLSVFAQTHQNHTAMAGDQNMRISADLASGGAGMAAFLWRLQDPRRRNPLFGLDGPGLVAA